MTKRATAVIVLASVALVWQAGSTWVAQAQAPAPAAGGRQRANPQGGSGPIRVALITKGHAYDREGLNVLLDSLGTDITWSHVEHPAAALLWDPKAAGTVRCLRVFRRARPAAAQVRPTVKSHMTTPEQTRRRTCRP